MDKSLKTNELLEIYSLVHFNYKEPANRIFGDCTKEVLTDFQAEEKS